jgi:hypothetical protein
VHPRRITDKRITHPSTLLAWAQKVLAEYKDPIYSYTVDAVNLAVHPDHTFDLENLEVGQIVRVVNSDLIDPLTGLGLNVNVKIVKVTTNLSDPKDISLELANATKSLADLISSSADTSSIVNNIAVQIGAGQVTVMGTFTVDGWRTTGQTTIDGGNITTNTITADAIKTSTLNAKTITLGTTGGDSIIKSGNYSAGSAGWQIKANGDAEFNNVVVRGTIATSTIGTGETLTVIGFIQSQNFELDVSGWYLSGSGQIFAKDVVVVDDVNCDEIIAPKQVLTKKLLLQGPSSSYSGYLQVSNDGLHLYFIDADSVSHTIV